MRCITVILLVAWTTLSGNVSNGYGQPLLYPSKEPVSRLLFNGQNMSGWVNVNCAPQSWKVENGKLHGSGAPFGILRTEQHYENYVLEFEYFNVNGQNGPVLYLHADALPAPGMPFPRGIKLSSKAGRYAADLSGVAGASIKTGRVPKVSAIRFSGLWDKYKIECRDGNIRVSVNDQHVVGSRSASLLKGYIGLAATGSDMIYRNITISELPSDHPPAQAVATLDEGFVSLYEGPDLIHWDYKTGHQGHWTGKNWLIDYDGKSEEKDKCLWSKKEFTNFVLIADVRFTREPEMAMSPVVLADGNEDLNEDGSILKVEMPYFGDTGIYLRGSSKNQVNIGNRYIGSGEIYGYRVDKKMAPEIREAVTPKRKADKPPGEWNRFIITMTDDRVTVSLNNEEIIKHARLPGIPEKGRIALQDDHWDNNTFQFANLFIKELP